MDVVPEVVDVNAKVTSNDNPFKVVYKKLVRIFSDRDPDQNSLEENVYTAEPSDEQPASRRAVSRDEPESQPISKPRQGAIRSQAEQAVPNKVVGQNRDILVDQVASTISQAHNNTPIDNYRASIGVARPIPIRATLRDSEMIVPSKAPINVRKLINSTMGRDVTQEMRILQKNVMDKQLKIEDLKSRVDEVSSTLQKASNADPEVVNKALQIISSGYNNFSKVVDTINDNERLKRENSNYSSRLLNYDKEYQKNIKEINDLKSKVQELQNSKSFTENDKQQLLKLVAQAPKNIKVLVDELVKTKIESFQNNTVSDLLSKISSSLDERGMKNSEFNSKVDMAVKEVLQKINDAPTVSKDQMDQLKMYQEIIASDSTLSDMHKFKKAMAAKDSELEFYKQLFSESKSGEVSEELLRYGREKLNLKNLTKDTLKDNIIDLQAKYNSLAASKNADQLIPFSKEYAELKSTSSKMETLYKEINEYLDNMSFSEKPNATRVEKLALLKQAVQTHPQEVASLKAQVKALQNSDISKELIQARAKVEQYEALKETLKDEATKMMYFVSKGNNLNIPFEVKDSTIEAYNNYQKELEFKTSKLAIIEKKLNEAQLDNAKLQAMQSVKDNKAKEDEIGRLNQRLIAAKGIINNFNLTQQHGDVLEMLSTAQNQLVKYQYLEKYVNDPNYSNSQLAQLTNISSQLYNTQKANLELINELHHYRQVVEGDVNNLYRQQGGRVALNSEKIKEIFGKAAAYDNLTSDPQVDLSNFPRYTALKKSYEDIVKAQTTLVAKQKVFEELAEKGGVNLENHIELQKANEQLKNQIKMMTENLASKENELKIYRASDVPQLQQLKGLIEEVSDLKNKLTQNQLASASSANDIALKQSELENMRAKYEDLISKAPRAADLDAQLKKNEQIIEDYKREISQLQNNSKQLDSELKSAKAKLEELKGSNDKQMIESLNKKIATLNNDALIANTEANLKIAELKNNITNSQEFKQLVIDLNNKNLEANKGLQDKIANLESEKASLSSKLELAQSTLSSNSVLNLVSGYSVETLAKQASDKITSLNNALAKKQQELDLAITKSKTVSLRDRENTLNVSQLQSQVTELQDSLLKAKLSENEAKIKAQVLQQENASILQKDANAKSMAQNAAVNEKIEEIKSLEAELNKMRRAKEQVEFDLKTQNQLNESAEKSIQSFQQTIENLRSQLQKSKLELSQAQSDVAFQKTMFENYKVSEQAKEEENNKQRLQLNTKLINDLKVQAQQHETDNIKLKSSLAAYTKVFEEFKDTPEFQNVEGDNRVSVLAEILKSRGTTINNLQKQLEAANKQYEEKLRELEEKNYTQADIEKQKEELGLAKTALENLRKELADIKVNQSSVVALDEAKLKKFTETINEIASNPDKLDDDKLDAVFKEYFGDAKSGVANTARAMLKITKAAISSNKLDNLDGRPTNNNWKKTLLIAIPVLVATGASIPIFISVLVAIKNLKKEDAGISANQLAGDLALEKAKADYQQKLDLAKTNDLKLQNELLRTKIAQEAQKSADDLNKVKAQQEILKTQAQLNVINRPQVRRFY